MSVKAALRKVAIGWYLKLARIRWVGMPIYVEEEDVTVFVRGVISQPVEDGTLFFLKCFKTRDPVFGRDPVQVWNLDIRNVQREGGRNVYRPENQ